jgi:hypothetical protein
LSLFLLTERMDEIFGGKSSRLSDGLLLCISEESMDF